MNNEYLDGLYAGLFAHDEAGMADLKRRVAAYKHELDERERAEEAARQARIEERKRIQRENRLNSPEFVYARQFIEDSDMCSRETLYEELECEYNSSVAKSVLKEIEVDWNKQAENAAKYLITTESVSCVENLEVELEYEGFSEDEIEYALDADAAEVKMLRRRDCVDSFNRSYYNDYNYSAKAIIEDLMADGHSRVDAQYVVEHSGIDWNERAYQYAMEAIKDNSINSRSDLIDYLEDAEYTREQVDYAIQKAKTELDKKMEACCIEEVKSYLNSQPYSRKELIEQLIDDGSIQRKKLYQL